jgi:hypothetical protein
LDGVVGDARDADRSFDRVIHPGVFLAVLDSACGEIGGVVRRHAVILQLPAGGRDPTVAAGVREVQRVEGLLREKSINLIRSIRLVRWAYGRVMVAVLLPFSLPVAVTT